jgi:hypothetical protein
VRQHRDRGCRVDPPEPLERLLRPGDDHLLGVREARVGRERGARIDHVGPPVGRPREAAQRRCDVDGPEQDQARRGRDHVHEHRAPAGGSLRPQQLAGDPRALVVELRRPERARADPAGRDEQLRARSGSLEHRDLGGAPTASRDLLERGGRGVAVGLHPHVDLATARQPDVPGLVIGDAELQQTRWLAGQHPLGHLDDGALHAAAGHRPRDLAGLADRHLRARRARRRAAHGDHGRQRDPLALALPALEFSKDLLHISSNSRPADDTPRLARA